MSKSFWHFLCLLVFSVFPLWAQVNYRASLPLVDGERFLGEVEAEIEDEKIQWVSKDSLISALRGSMKEESLRVLDQLPEQIKAQQLPWLLKFNPQELRLETTLNLENRKSENIDVLEDYKKRYSGEALTPAPFGGAVNYRLEQTMSQQPEQEFFSGQFDSFLNFQGVVLENQSFYQSNLEHKWFRGDTRLVKDIQEKQIRMQAGDVYPQVQGFMSARPVGGINLSRNFSLNPYRLPYPLAEQSFTLRSRSQVRYFVNNIFIKSENLPPGNYTARDIPLNNGLNTILIEATDDTGKKQYFIFRAAASINLLNQGESRFDLSYGTPFFDNNFKREYLEEEGKLFSGFYQHGLTQTFSGSVYLQNQQDFSLYGSEVIKATTVGNFNLGHAFSRDSQLNGTAESVAYQFVSQGREWYESHSIGLRYEYRSEDFRSSRLASASSIKNNYAANYTLPLPRLLTLSLGGNFGDMRDNELENRYGYDVTVNTRIFNHHNLSFFVGRSRDEFRRWNEVAYVFVTIAFPGSNDFVSGLYDHYQKSSRLSYVKDNQNRLHDPRIQANIENNEKGQIGEVDLVYPSAFADWGGRIRGDHRIEQDDYQNAASLRMNSAFVFAYDDEWGAGFSRPVNNSFALFKPHQRLKGQKIALKSFSSFTEAESGPFDEIVYNNLLPYQYREVQLDPTMMDLGRTLEKEKFVLLPSYRSAHLIPLSDRGSVILTGRLVDAKGKPKALAVGSVGGKSFFTNREGEFFIEGVNQGQHHLSLDGSETSLPLTISRDELGIKNIGTLTIEE